MKNEEQYRILFRYSKLTRSEDESGEGRKAMERYHKY